MASFVLQASCGEQYLGEVRQSAVTKRWEVSANGWTYSFRDPDGAAEALKMLADSKVETP